MNTSSNTHTVMASRLELRSPRYLVRFLRATLAIRRQLATAPGLVGYKLRARLHRVTFFTLSAWEDENGLSTFAKSDPHATLVAQLKAKGAMRGAQFVTWQVDAGSPFPVWDDALAHLEAAGPSSRR